MKNYFKLFNRRSAPIDNYSLAFVYEDDYVYRVCPLRSSPVSQESTCVQVIRYRLNDLYYYSIQGCFGNFYSDLSFDKLDIDSLLLDIEENYISLFNLYKLIVDYGKRKKNSQTLG